MNCATQIGDSSAERSRRHASSALQFGPRLGLDEQLAKSRMRTIRVVGRKAQFSGADQFELPRCADPG